MKRRQRFANITPNARSVADRRQSFYVTLDISAAADYNNLRSKKKKPDPPPPKFPQSATSIVHTSPTAQDNAGPSEPPETLLQETPAPMDIDPALGQPEEEPLIVQPQPRIQILDLHTQNPLISYQNQIYSCEWTSTLGTDILLTAPAPDFSYPVLRAKPNVSVLAASSIKLMGHTAQIASRHSAEESGQPSTPAPENPVTSINTASAEKAMPVKIPLAAIASRARQNQANFLERLIAIKAKKGEKDKVTVYTQKVNQGSGWRSQRRASDAIEDAEDEITPKQARRGSGTGGRPRGSRRLRGPRTAKGGLFRDYRPQLWDTPGADIRDGPSSTPESWDQLDVGTSDGRQTPAVTTANASPAPADPPVQPANRSLSASASANPSPTPSLRPAYPTNSETVFPADHATPSPSPALSLEPQPAIVIKEGTAPGSRVRHAAAPQQRRTEGLVVEQSTAAPDTASGNLGSPGVAAAGDAEMEDVG